MTRLQFRTPTLVSLAILLQARHPRRSTHTGYPRHCLTALGTGQAVPRAAQGLPDAHMLPLQRQHDACSKQHQSCRLDLYLPPAPPCEPGAW